MSKAEQIRAKLRNLEADAKKILDDADANNGGELTQEQEAKFDAIMADVEKQKSALVRAEQMDRLTSENASSSGRIVLPATAKTEAEKEYARTGGFADHADFAIAVQLASAKGSKNYVDPRLSQLPQVLGAPSNYHREGGSSDGYMVPPAIRDAIWELVSGDEDIFGQTDVEPTGSNAVEVAVDQTTPWGSSGIQAFWGSEAGQMQQSRLDTKFEQMQLHKLHAFALVTDELLEDAPRLNDRLTRKAAAAIQWKSSDAVIYGTGAGQPKGYFNSNALVTVSKEAGQAADTINVDNIAKMFSRMLGSSISNSVWLANSDILPQLMKLSIGQQPVWTPPSSGMKEAPGGFLMGRPVQFSEHCKTLGDLGDLQFVDLKGYYAARKASGVKFAESMHLYFDYDMMAFRWTFRIGGQPYLTAPVSPANGTNTKSHFVVLEAR